MNKKFKKNKFIEQYRTGKISSTTEEYVDEHTPIDDISDILNYCRLDHYKLYKKDFKVASIRLRQNLEFIIQTAKQMKKEALIYRKGIEEKERIAKEEAIRNGLINKKLNGNIQQNLQNFRRF
jgi:hypothetical protein